MSTISIIMVSYHTGDRCLNLALDAALAEPECHELILINNGNPPGVVKALTARAAAEKRLKLISGQGNVGFARACNLGAKAATGDYVLLLNPDCMLAQGSLAEALKAIAPYPEQTLAGCNLLNPSGSEQRGGRRGLMTPMNAFCDSFNLDFLLPKEQRLSLHTTKMPQDVHEVPAISGAFMLLARSYYQKLKGMDERYFLHMEDMDLCYRVHKSGGKTVCMPTVRVIHFRGTSEASSNVVEKHKARSFVRYLNIHAQDGSSAFLAKVMVPAIWTRYYLKSTFGGLLSIFEPPLHEKQKTARMVTLHRAMRFAQPNPAMQGKVALVTGATGQLGLHIVAALLASGVKVIAVGRRTKIPFRHENVAWVERDFARDAKPLHGANVDMVIHAANIRYLPRLLPDIGESGARRMVAFSCLSLADKLVSAVQRDKKRADVHMALQKELLGFGRQKNMEVTLFALADMYGAGLDNSLTAQADVIRRYGRMAVEYPATGMRQPVHVEDVARLAVESLANPVAANKTYMLGGADRLTYKDMLTRVFAYYGIKPSFVRIPAMKSLLNILGRVYGIEGMNADMMQQMNRSIVADNTLAVQELGYQPRAFLAGDTGF